MEVVIAVSILLIAALALGGFTVKSLQTTQDNLYQNGAVAIGSQRLASTLSSLEKARDAKGLINTNNPSTLQAVTGSSSEISSLTTCFTQTSNCTLNTVVPVSVPAISASNVLSSSSSTDSPVKTVKSGDKDYTYTVTTLIGTCYMTQITSPGSTNENALGNALSCDKTALTTRKSGAQYIAQSADVAARSMMLRVTVIVQWKNDSCTNGGDNCSYATSGLVNASRQYYKGE